MYSEPLKENIEGVVGSFILERGKMRESDLNLDLHDIVQNIFFLAETITEKKNLNLLVFFGEKNSLFIYFHQPLIVGIVFSRLPSIPALEDKIKRVLESGNN